MRRLLLPFLLSLWPVTAMAEDVRLSNDDTQLWTTLQLQVATGRRGEFATVQFQNRMTSNLSRASLQSLRLGYGGPLGRNANLQAGYSLFQSQPLNRAATMEHRFWQQVQGPAWQWGAVQFSWRVGLEERLFERFGDLGLRARGQLRASTAARLAPVVLAEGFYNLNSTDWGQRAGRDQLRLMAGASLRVSPHASVEAGYTYTKLWRAGGDRKLDVIGLSLFLRG